MAAMLVTGGAGFIGSHVADEIIKLGHEVVVLDDLSGGFRDNIPARAEFVEGSILDQALLAEIFEAWPFEVVYHFAAYAAEGLSHFIKHFNYENNLIGSVNLINCAVNHGVRRFVFTSSIAVYGAAQVPMSEDQPPSPEDPYGIAKLAVERELEVTRQVFGLDYVVFRPHNVYGEKQNTGDHYRNVIGIFMNQLMQEQPMTVFGDGEQRRAFTYIGDVAPTIARAGVDLAFRNNVFNIGSDQAITVNELASQVAAALGRPAKLRYLSERHEVKVAYCAHDKLQRFVGPLAHTALPDGLARMARWALQVGPRKSKPFNNIEIERNMPPSWRTLCSPPARAGAGGDTARIRHTNGRVRRQALAPSDKGPTSKNKPHDP
jgi:UDP-glucose 4-epimerase